MSDDHTVCDLAEAGVTDTRPEVGRGEPIENLPGMVGRHPLILEVFRLGRLAAQCDAPVLVVGETGTGKELVAQAIHALSERAGKEVVDLNCAALPEQLVESELFGVEAGAYTDARRCRAGLLAAADGSTLLLDELCSMTLRTQAKLLRVLETKRYRRVGGTRPFRADFRLVATARRRAHELVADGLLRADLAYRVAIVEIAVPPLQARASDIPALVAHLLARRGRARSQVAISPEALARLIKHPWPGNVRQLAGALERLVTLAPAGLINATLVERVLGPAGLTRERVREALRESAGSVREAARQLRVPRTNLRRFLDRERELATPV